MGMKEGRSSTESATRLPMAGVSAIPRLPWIRWSLLAVVVATTATAAWWAEVQPPWEDVDRPPSTWRSWAYPRESNAERRLAAIQGDLFAVGASPVRAQVVVAAGSSGLIVRSEDGGRTWRQAAFPLDDFRRVERLRRARRRQQETPPPAPAPKSAAQVEPRFVPGATPTVVARRPTPAGRWRGALELRSVAYQADQPSLPAEAPASNNSPPAVTIVQPTDESDEAPIPAPHLFDVLFSPDGRGWIAGDGVVLASTDAGASWTVAYPSETSGAPAAPRIDFRWLALDSTSGSSSTPSVYAAGNLSLGESGSVVVEETIGQIVRFAESPSKNLSGRTTLDVKRLGPADLGIDRDWKQVVFQSLRTRPDGRPQITAGGVYQPDGGGKPGDKGGAGRMFEQNRPAIESDGVVSSCLITCAATGPWTVDRPADWPSAVDAGGRRWRLRTITDVLHLDDAPAWAVAVVVPDPEPDSTKTAPTVVGPSGASQAIGMPASRVLLRIEADGVRSKAENLGAEPERPGVWMLAPFVRPILSADSLVLQGADGRVRIRTEAPDGSATWEISERPPEAPSAGSSASNAPSASNGPSSVQGSPTNSISQGPASSTGLDEKYDLEVLPDGRGWLVGARGAVHSTSDGGRNWIRRTRPADGAAGPAYVRRAGVWYFLLWVPIVGGLYLVFLPLRSPAKPNVDQRSHAAGTMVTDRPLRLGDADALNFGPLARSIVGFIRNRQTQPPLTMAIQGAWGSGKSSLMNLVTFGLEQSGHRCVWFNAWHHQSSDHLLAALLQVIRDRAAPPPFHPHFFPGKLRLFARRLRRPSVTLPLLVFVACAAFVVASDWFPTSPRAVFRKLLELFDQNGGGVWSAEGFAKALSGIGLGGGTIGSLSVFLWRSLRAFVSKPASLSVGANSGAHERELQTTFRYRFADEFREFTEVLQPYRLVVFIDDLDRCHAEQVMEVLEAVNFLVTSGDCFVVMGLDRDRVLKCVGKRFREVEDLEEGSGAGEAEGVPSLSERAAAYANSYLEKLINIPIQVPAPRPSQWEELIDSAMQTPAESAAQDDAQEQERQRREQAAELTRKAERQIRRATSGLAIVVLTLIALFSGYGLAEMAKNELASYDQEAGDRAAARERESAPWDVLLRNQLDLLAVMTGDRTGRSASPPWSSLVRSVVELFDTPSRPVAAEAPLDSPPLDATLPRFEGPIVAAEREQEVSVDMGDATAGEVWRWLSLAIAMSLLLLGVLYGLSTMVVMSPPAADDSQEFREALLRRLDLITVKKRTPRALKKFLNELRYMASLQEPPPDAADPPLTQWLLNYFGAKADPAPNGSTVADGRRVDIRDLVDLAVIDLFDPTWVQESNDVSAEQVKSKRDDLPALTRLREVSRSADELLQRRSSLAGLRGAFRSIWNDGRAEGA